ncbi:MAG: hypothetical protein ACLR7U_06185 [Ruthenibacterium lactatiformans]
MEWKRMDAYQTLVARLQENTGKGRCGVGASDEGVPGNLARARKMRCRLADNLCMPSLLWQQTQK